MSQVSHRISCSFTFDVEVETDLHKSRGELSNFRKLSATWEVLRSVIHIEDMCTDDAPLHIDMFDEFGSILYTSD